MKSTKQIKDPANWLETIVKDYINESPENVFKIQEENEKIWEDPLIGFSNGNDPLYQEYKKHIGSFYWTPVEIFTKTFPQIKVSPDQLTVISWILPQTEATKSDNRRQTHVPSERWAKARKYGEEVNKRLREHVVALLKKAGHEAVAPFISPLFEMKATTCNSVEYHYASTWSERHAAYASGLGTFGLCDGLITPKGKAVRCGSVVAHIQIPPTKRPYHDHHAYCLFFTEGSCKKCIKRCPAGAITEAGHNKMKCYQYTNTICVDYIKSHYGFKDTPCGLCQTDVPCESEIPKIRKQKRVKQG
jgi:epoxyqueuosine reductase QueG